MNISKIVHTVSCHAEGEVGDVIVGGVAPPPGETLDDQRRFLAEDQALRNFMLNEPRGGVFRHVNLLVPPKHRDADAAFLIMEPEDTPLMSGSNTICVATVLLNTGIVPITGDITPLTLEVPGGLVKVEATCTDGVARRIKLHNIASFADRLDADLEVAGLGSLKVDTAFGGDSFVLVDAKTLGFDLHPSEAADLAATGAKLVDAANEQLGFDYPQKGWDHISFCQFTGELTVADGVLSGRNTVSIKPGKLDRSPCGTGCSARMAVEFAKGRMRVGDVYHATSIIGSNFECRIENTVSVAGRAGIVPSISGRAWITGTHQHTLSADDPWPHGYRVGDTWPS